MATISDFSFKPDTSKVICATLVSANNAATYMPPVVKGLEMGMELLTLEGSSLSRSDVKSVVEGKTGIEEHTRWVCLFSDKTNYRIYIDDFNKEIERLRNE